ncbi:MAG: NADH-quinone oxidoreductase subunit NuoN [Gammaproteobacteria bacterium]|nr:NADH-quinone oxidoreductase subunit NuoN [Gammaproteobacteria bacterium]
MSVDVKEFIPLMPEIFLLSMACIILIVDLYLSDANRSITYGLSVISLAITGLITFQLMPTSPEVVLAGTFVSDQMSAVLKMFVYLVTAIVMVYSGKYLKDRSLYKGEFFVLVLFGVLGMMVMISAHSMLTIYLGLELLSLCLYALVAMHRDSMNATEAAMKYFILGALASGLLLYGMSMLYGASGTLDLGELAKFIAAGDQTDLVLLMGAVFVVVGLAFKLGAVPFHMWVPDVYHGSPTATTLFIGTAPKLAGFAMIMRLMVEGMGDLHAHWQEYLIILAVLSMVIGNVIAIAQTNLKRMLAYSTIAHMGFVLLGILAGNEQGYSAAMFYTIAYAIMGLGGFGMILLLSRKGFEAEDLNDFKGLNDRSPWFAFMMLIFLFSMAGVPPTLGFYAKLAVLQAVVNIEMVWLAIVAVIFSIVGAFYYLRAVKIMYFDKAEDHSPITSSADMRATLSANGLLVVALGIYPSGLIALCVQVFS